MLIDDDNMHIRNFFRICTSYNFPGVSQDAMRLRLFPFNFIGKAILWLGILQLKDEIYNFKHLHSEALYETWLRLKKKLMTVLNHRILGKNLLEIFYGFLNVKTKVIAYIITGRAFMTLTWELAMKSQIESLISIKSGILERQKEKSVLMLLVLPMSKE